MSSALIENRNWLMRYRIPVLLFCILGVARLADAQKSPKLLPKIGLILSSGSRSSPLLEAFLLGLHEHGYVDGQNVAIERRYAEGKLDRMAPFVREFVNLKVDVIIGVNNAVIRAAKDATNTIPIVMISSIDPIAAGYVASYANPGGNITGLAWLHRDLSAKRVEFLKELLPKLKRVGILWDPDGPGPAIALKEYQRAARDFKLQSHSIEVRGPNPNLASTFQELKSLNVNALIVVGNPLLTQFSKQIFDLATSNRLPTMAEDRRYVDAGGLISYGANVDDLYRHAANYVAKLLQGVKPTDLPVEEANKFELVFNHKTAKEIGITIPASLLAKGDK